MILWFLSPILLFLILNAITNKYMTEKRNFTFRDKLILTTGGFLVVSTIGLIIEDAFLLLLAMPFLLRTILLIFPIYTKMFRNMRR